MTAKSSFDRMDPAVKAELDQMIAAGRLSIDQLHAYLGDLGPETLGLDAVPSRSAVGRRVKKFKEVADRMRQERELAAALALELKPESQEGEQARVLVDMLRTFLSQMLRVQLEKDDGGFDPKDLARIAKTVKDLSHSMRLEQDFEQRIREAAVKETREAAARAVTTEGRKRGLGLESIEAIKNRILGVKADGEQP